ncbi:Ada metal-binding domain-containing protein [Streptomyces sp. NBC_00989]
MVGSRSTKTFCRMSCHARTASLT